MGEMRLDVINIGKYHRTRAGQLAPSHLIGFTPAQLNVCIYTSQPSKPFKSRDQLKPVNITIRNKVKESITS